VDLFESRNELAKNLSGGQKRKLNISIALIGDPKVCIQGNYFSSIHSCFYVFLDNYT
jgi:ABC-type branched-subunit amino acid transport system ATPase component